MPSVPRRPRRFYRFTPTPEQIALALQMLAEGKSHNAIAKAWGVADTIVSRRYAAFGLPEPQHFSPTSEMIADAIQMRGEGRLIREIAAKWGVSDQTTIRHLNAHGVPTKMLPGKDAEIARQLGISPQRVYQKKHKDRCQARMAVYQAIRSGRLVRPDTCQECGKACFTEAHHDDYSKRLEVRFLCSPCHRKADQSRRAQS